MAYKVHLIVTLNPQNKIFFFSRPVRDDSRGAPPQGDEPASSGTSPDDFDPTVGRAVDVVADADAVGVASVWKSRRWSEWNR